MSQKGCVMKDRHNEVGTGERKLIRDEENRLLAVDDNGFVSNYWYDADDERTVKPSGESDQVYVNGVFSLVSHNLKDVKGNVTTSVYV